MELLEPTWRQHLSYGSCAIALVFSLSLYKTHVSANPLSLAQRHWEAIEAADPELLVNRYSKDAVLKRSYDVSDASEVYQGHSIYSAWREFFWQYQIQDFQVVKRQRRDRGVEAQIQITAKSHRGAIVILSMSYQAQFDRTGKIIKEVWQANPEVGA
jgi:hypothetical protein